MGHGIGNVGNKSGNAMILAAGNLNITHGGMPGLLSLSHLLVFTGGGQVALLVCLVCEQSLLATKGRNNSQLGGLKSLFDQVQFCWCSDDLKKKSTCLLYLGYLGGAQQVDGARWGARRAPHARSRVAEIMQATRASVFTGAQTTSKCPSNIFVNSKKLQKKNSEFFFK